jgi:hypothetical protein
MILTFTACLLAATVSAGERTPAVMIVVVPKEVTPRAPSSALVDAAAAVLNRTTRLALLPAERAGTDLARFAACEPAERYRCWLEATARDQTRYLFVLGVQPDALSLIFLDLEAAKTKIATIPQDAPDRAEQVEAEIFNLTVRAPPVQVDSLSRHALEAWFSERLEGPIRIQLTKNGDATPLGAIAVRTPVKGWPLALDGETIAATSTSAVLLTDVRPGVRRIAITPPGGPPIPRDVRVESAKTATVSFTFGPPVASTDDGTLRYGLIFGGIAASSIGGVLLASVVSRASNVREACVRRMGDDTSAECPGLGAITLEHDAARLPSLDPERVNPRGVSMAPLAIGLLGGGAIIAVGTFFLRHFEEDWWWPLVAGVGFGAVSYGFGALVDPR